MRISPRIFGLLIGVWGLATAFLGREGLGGCPLGSCPACGACLPPPPVAEECRETRCA